VIAAGVRPPAGFPLATGGAASQATQILRALQARGLLRARRRGAWVLYAPDANPSIAHAPALAAALLTLALGDRPPTG
jgi:DNA-binding transcriptional ArsR family regulator